jgi:hypothetical protein
MTKLGLRLKQLSKADLPLRQDRERAAFAERNKKLNAFLAGKVAGLQL